MASGGKCQPSGLWSLDSLADVAQPKEWQAAGAEAQEAAGYWQGNTLEPDTETKLQGSGLHGSLAACASDLMPVGLDSAVAGTHGNLQWLLTQQIASLPEDLPAGEGYGTLEDNLVGLTLFDSVVNTGEDSIIPFLTEVTAAPTAPAQAAAPAGQDTAHSTAAAGAALAEAAAAPDTTIKSSSLTPGSACSQTNLPAATCLGRQSSLVGQCSTSVFAAALPYSLRTSSTASGASFRLQEQHATPSMRHSLLLSPSSMRSVGLPRAATLKAMERSNAWEELHGIQGEQQGADAAEPIPALNSLSSSFAAAAAAADSSIVGAKLQQQSSNRQEEEGTALAYLLQRILAGLSLSSVVSAAASFIASLLYWQPHSPVSSSSIQKTSHKALSTDGWTLHLVHCHDSSLQPRQRRSHPILMCPGLASSGPGTFDLLPHVSLAEFLAAAGWDVGVADIRGNGLADKSSRIDVEQDWNIDDYLVQDVPACIEYVLKHSPCKANKLHWVGHSMGGMLACGLCSQAGKWGKRLRSVTLLGSGCFGDGSWHVVLKKLVVPVTSFGFPAHITGQGLALLANTPVALSVFEALFYWPANVEQPVRKALLATCFNFIPARLVQQFLHSHGSVSGLANSSGNFLYADPDVLGMCKVPVLGINGDWDLFCPAAGGGRTVDLFGGPKQHVTLGPAHGHAAHYGHFDVIVGRNAPGEAWPHLQAFLEQHDAPASLQQLWDACLLREGDA